MTELTVNEAAEAAATAVAAATMRAKATLSTDPMAAYALGLGVKLVQLANREHEEDADMAAALPKRICSVMEDQAASLERKQALVQQLERATDLRAAWQACSGSNNSSDNSIPATTTTTSSVVGGTNENEDEIEIPAELGCAICRDELMLKPASLLCGHSFCKRCLDEWLMHSPNCPTCREPVPTPTSITPLPPTTTTTTNNNSTTGGVHYEEVHGRLLPMAAVNLALQEALLALYPAKLHEMKQRDEQERMEHLREVIRKSLETHQSIPDLLAQDQHRHLFVGENAQEAVAALLDTDMELHEQVLAAEIRERLRQERALREASRRRHIMAYCTHTTAPIAAATAAGVGTMSPDRAHPPTESSSSSSRVCVQTRRQQLMAKSRADAARAFQAKQAKHSSFLSGFFSVHGR